MISLSLLNFIRVKGDFAKREFENILCGYIEKCMAISLVNQLLTSRMWVSSTTLRSSAEDGKCQSQRKFQSLGQRKFQSLGQRKFQS
jgi:hypothetical protein